MRILVPAPRAIKATHEAQAATSAGGRHEWTADAVSIFTLGVPGEKWHPVVLAVADGQGWPARGDLASGVAVDSLEDGLTGWADHLEFTSHAWQEPVATAFASAFEHANARVRALLTSPDAELGRGVALTAAALLGNWLCVANAGDCRVYRLSRTALEQMTADHGTMRPGRSQPSERPVRALGLAAHVTPAIHFFRLKPGDVVLVCSNGIGRQLNGRTMAQLMGAQGPVGDIAKSLVTAAGRRGGDEDFSACLARVGRLPGRRLPDPAGHVAAAPVTVVRYQARRAPPLDRPRLGVMLVALALVAASIGGWRLWRPGPQLAAPVVLVAPALPPPASYGMQATAPVAPLASPEAKPASPVAPPAVPVKDMAAARRAVVVPVDSLKIIQHQNQVRRERIIRDSVAAEKRQAEERRIRDSLLAAQVTAAAQQKERVQREAQARADQEAAAKAAATVAAAAAAATAERAREEKLAEGKNALTDWMNSLVSSVNTGIPGASVLASGPPGFAAFVEKNQPRLSDARLLTTTVNEQTGEATAEWVAKWRTAFGTAMSRHMKATATVVPNGNAWRLRDWRITEGAP